MESDSKKTLLTNGRAATTGGTFSRETAVQIDIEADPAVVWRLLTQAKDYPRWNSTIISLTGNIKKGEKIELKSTLDDKRTFKLKVLEMEPEKRLVWGDNKGSRTFTLARGSDNKLTVTMSEKIGGLFFPLYAKYLPSFDESFERFAADLKKEDEAIQNSQK